jgi:hypothetical protein
MEWGGVGFSKYSMLVLLVVALIAFLWRFGRTVFKGVTRWLLWVPGVNYLGRSASIILAGGSEA